MKTHIWKLAVDSKFTKPLFVATDGNTIQSLARAVNGNEAGTLLVHDAILGAEYLGEIANPEG